MTSYRYGGIGSAAAIAMVVALGACGGGGDKQPTAEEQLEDAFDQLSEDLDEPVETTVEEEAEAPPEPVVVDLDLPRSADYAMATWTVTQVSYQGPGVDDLGLDVDPRAIVEFTVANTGEGGVDMDVDYQLVSLLDGDGARVPADYESLEASTVVFGGEAEFEATILLDADATEDDLADYTFEVGEQGFVPAEIPLSGAVPEPAYPINLTMPASVSGTVIGGPGTIGNIHGTVTLDYAGERAREDTRFIIVSGDVLLGENGGHVNHNDVRLSLDGIQLERAQPAPHYVGDRFAAGATASATWVFVAPVEGKQGALHFGGQSPPENPSGPFTVPDLP